MRRWFVAVAPLLATVSLAVAAVGGSAAEPAVFAKSVVIGDSFFQPESITVEAGETVIWTNTGQFTHTVTAEGGEFDSGTISPGTSYTLQLTTVGNYGYYCTVHGPIQSGILIVQAAPTAATTEPPTPRQTAPPTDQPAPSSTVSAGSVTPTETPSGSLTPGPRTPRPTGETFTPRATPERSLPPTTDPIGFDDGGGASSMPFVVGGFIAALALAGVGFYAYRVYAGRGSEPPDPPWRRRL